MRSWLCFLQIRDSDRQSLSLWIRAAGNLHAQAGFIILGGPLWTVAGQLLDGTLQEEEALSLLLRRLGSVCLAATGTATLILRAEAVPSVQGLPVGLLDLSGPCTK
jgi:hypothetical protein